MNFKFFEGTKVPFWVLAIGLLVLAFAFSCVGRLVRQYAYHAGHGYGLGIGNVPELFWSVPWPIVWLLGAASSTLCAVLVILAVGIGREIRFLLLLAAVLGLGHVVGDLVFYILFKKEMEFAYRKLDKFDSESKTQEKLKDGQNQ